MTENNLRFKHALQLLRNKYRASANNLILLRKKLNDIFRVNRALTCSADLKKMSLMIAQLTCDLIHTDSCVVRILSADKKTLTISAGHSVSEALIKDSASIGLGEGLSGIAAQTRRPLVVSDIEKDWRVKYKELLIKEGMRSALVVPVIFKDRVLGVISAGSRKERHFSREEIEILNIFASHVAAAIKEYQYYNDMRINYFNTINALVLTLEARDPYTRGHTERVTEYALRAVREMKIKRSDVDNLRYAAKVHDVGKISIPDFILNKPGKLNPAERAMIELHPVKGVDILEPLAFLKSALPIVRHHHEWYDGSGYPDGLQRDNIPFLARILACADAFDAMTSDRPYRRNNLTTQEAFAEIKRHCGTQFDPHVANQFMAALKKS